MALRPANVQFFIVLGIPFLFVVDSPVVVILGR
jgi:hypothetical protein